MADDDPSSVVHDPLVPLTVSLAALLLSAFVFLHNRRAGKRDLLLKMHEQLLHADRQHGRRVLFELAEQRRHPEDLTPDDFRSANHALATLDLMGFLFTKRYIPRGDAIALWGVTTRRLYRAAEETGFIALRDKQNAVAIWPYLRQFVAHADRKLAALPPQEGEPPSGTRPRSETYSQ